MVGGGGCGGGSGARVTTKDPVISDDLANYCLINFNSCLLIKLPSKSSMRNGVKAKVDG